MPELTARSAAKRAYPPLMILAYNLGSVILSKNGNLGKHELSTTTMALKGERFHIDLPDALSGIQDAQENSPGQSLDDRVDTNCPIAPVKDILERPTNSTRAPKAPAPKTHGKGFPEHKKRTPLSKLRRGIGAEGEQIADAAKYVAEQARPATSGDDDESTSIDKENVDRMAHMSSVEIDGERKDLFEHLSPSLIQRFMKHSTARRRGVINDTSASEDTVDSTTSQTAIDEAHVISEKPSTKRVTFEDVAGASGSPSPAADKTGSHGRAAHVSASEEEPSFHFPNPNQPPSLDPSSPSFFNDLHEKYFASLPADPSKLAWMQHSKSGTTYDGNSKSVQVAELRFDFSGALITPRQAEQISVTEGLHHHEEASSSAGYTLPELARLTRSAVASQRCIAFQTLGRIMYRLGIGEYGSFNDQIPQGLWLVIRDGAIIETLEQEANRKAGHTSAKAYATEALWLWQKGGGRRLAAT